MTAEPMTRSSRESSCATTAVGQTLYRIPFNSPSLVGSELEYIAEALEHMHISGRGRFAARCSSLIEEAFGTPKALLTTSCTTALEMCSILLEIGPGDEVIMPSFSYVSTVNAFVLRGGKPIFVDIRPDTLNLDETLLEAAITPKTRAIVPMHYAGVACDMDAILDVSSRHGIAVVEDAAQGVDATWKGRYLGTMGDLGTYSFHETKNIMCGEGGALLVNNEKYLERAEIILEKGTNRSQFLRGLTDKYTWVDVGSSFSPSDMLAAFLYAQLENRKTIKRRRRELWATYAEGLSPLVERGLVELQEIPDGCGFNHHIFPLLARDLEERTALIAHLDQKSIKAVFHYVPLHTSPMGRKLGYREGDLPVTERQSRRVVRLPMYFTLTPNDQQTVIDEIHRFYKCTDR